MTVPDKTLFTAQEVRRICVRLAARYRAEFNPDLISAIDNAMEDAILDSCLGVRFYRDDNQDQGGGGGSCTDYAPKPVGWRSSR